MVFGPLMAGVPGGRRRGMGQAPYVIVDYAKAAEILEQFTFATSTLDMARAVLRANPDRGAALLLPAMIYDTESFVDADPVVTYVKLAQFIVASKIPQSTNYGPYTYAQFIDSAKRLRAAAIEANTIPAGEAGQAGGTMDPTKPPLPPVEEPSGGGVGAVIALALIGVAIFVFAD